MKFAYKAYDKDNKLVSGQLEASEAGKARLFLIEQGYEVINLVAVKETKALSVGGLSSIGTVSLEQKMLFVKHLSLMVKSGMPINEALQILAEDSKGRLKAILVKVLKKVEAGSKLSVSLEKYNHVFNKFFVSMVAVGEQSGTLEQSLINLAEHLKKSHELVSKIRSALIYPTIIFTAVLGLGFTLSVFVLPKLTGFFISLQAELPLSTRILLAFSNYMQAHWKGTLVGLIILIVLLFVSRYFKPTRYFFHAIYLRIPVVKDFAKKSNLASLCRSMALLLDSGMTLDTSLEIAKGNVRNAHYEKAIEEVIKQVKGGESLGNSMVQFELQFPNIVSRMIKVGEKSGNLAETFSYLATFYEDEIETMSKNLSSIIEPFLLLVIGGTVAFVAMSIITPIYDLTSNVGR